ncbi:UDP-N-acetylglucosamine 2-epimerase [Candidatus Woesearchaeota archaeon]|nr:UDP-N-acetylglucosamine 2-epimerase [Candidatus Woesearchaeota archaeon]
MEKNNTTINQDYPEMIFLKEFADKTILDGKNIKQLLTYEQTSLWWFAERWLADASFYHYPSLKGIFKGEPLPEKNIFSLLYTFLLNHLEQARFVVRKYIIPQHSLDLNNQEDTIVVTTHPSYCVAANNIRIGPLIEKIRQQHKKLFVFYYDDLASWGGKTKLQTSMYSDTNPIEKFYSIEIMRKVSQEKKKYAALGKKILTSPEFKKALQTRFKGKELDLYTSLYKKFQLMFSKILPEAITYILLSKEMLKATKPKIVVTMSGNTTPGKSVIVAAKRLGIPVLEIQEGLIGYDLDYVHTQKDIADHYPLADLIAVYGEHTKQFLVKQGSFPQEKIHIVGQLASDNLVIIKNSMQKKNKSQELKQRLGINPEEKVVVYATSIDKEPWKTYDLATELFKSVAAVAQTQNQDKKQLRLVVKLHPRDPHEAWYRKLAHQQNLDDVIFIKDTPIYELFAITDALIAESSTIVLEAIMFGVPVVLICFSSNIRDQGYIASNAVVVTEKKQNLTRNIFAILYGKDIQQELKKNTQEFLKKQVYKIDGKVADRVLQLVGRY